MARKTIIFGNGLGMALDAEFFSLDKAIEKVWNNQDLDKPQKDLIRQCLPDRTHSCPHGEDDMDTLQVALSACDLLNGIRGAHTHWLTEQGQNFPYAVRKLLYKVASSFHQSPKALPEPFSDSLGEFLKKTKSHVATLNYDNLVYQPLIEREVLKGYDGALCDGFYEKKGFSPENLERRYRRDFGYYLHLHGSPLFVDRDGVTFKLDQGELANNTDVVRSHIVLTHVKHKPAVIGASQLLTTYWQYLDRAFQESDEIVLVGYSGRDAHLNELLKRWTQQKPFRVVEWNGEDDEATRQHFWSGILPGSSITVVPLASILDFKEWDSHDVQHAVPADAALQHN